jgi:hypothetical protein
MCGMRRTILLAAVALLAAATASAINTDTHPLRIGLLAAPDRGDRRDVQTSDHVRNLLRAELRELGYDAFLTGDRVEDLGPDTPAADFYLDVAGADHGSYPVGGVGVGGRSGFVDVGILIGRVAASVTIYDGRSLELLRTIDLQKRNTAVAPTGIGVGGRSFWTFIALPIVEWGQQRAAIRAIARDAARRIDEALRP